MLTEQTLTPKSNWIDDPISSPRISFSSEFLDESNFISICPNSNPKSEQKIEKSAPDFEFLSSLNSTTTNTMITADELISEGKLLPFRQIEKKLSTISLKSNENLVDRNEILTKNNGKEESRISWFLDDDPSPRPPKCTVLWKELLRLRKQRSSSSLSSNSSSSNSSNSSEISSEISSENNEKKSVVKGIKKGLMERSRSGSIRIRPVAVINVPICTTAPGTKSGGGGLPPLFSMRRGGRLER